jgi:hypothetical protein
MLSFAVAIGVAAYLLLVAVPAVRGLAQASLWAGLVAALAGVVAAGAAVWPLVAHPPKPPPSAKLEIAEEVVDRPAELNAVVAALQRLKG